MYTPLIILNKYLYTPLIILNKYLYTPLIILNKYLHTPLIILNSLQNKFTNISNRISGTMIMNYRKQHMLKNEIHNNQKKTLKSQC